MIRAASKMMTVQVLFACPEFAFLVSTAGRTELRLMLTVGGHAHRAAQSEGPVLQIRIVKLESATCNHLSQDHTLIRIFLGALEARAAKVLNRKRTAKLHAARHLGVAVALERAGATGTTGSGSSEQEALVGCHRMERRRLSDRRLRVHAALSRSRNCAGTEFMTMAKSELTVEDSVRHWESSVRTVWRAVHILTVQAIAALGRKALRPRVSAVATEL